MTLAEQIKENDRRVEKRINKEIDICGMAYKINIEREINLYLQE